MTIFMLVSCSLIMIVMGAAGWKLSEKEAFRGFIFAAFVPLALLCAYGLLAEFAPAYAAEITEEPDVVEVVSESEAESDYESLLAEWQERLGLLDWEIHLSVNVKREEMGVPGASGCAHYVESKKWAEIQIAEPEAGIVWDPEQTLVHELMHLKLALLHDEDSTYANSPTYSRVEHQIVDDMAKALVSAKRVEP